MAMLIAGAPLARADQPAKPYRLAYRAHAGCPSSAGFVAAVARRLDGATLEDGARLGLEIDIVRKGASSHGLLVADDGALRTVREVDAKTCADVVEALAYIATVAIENAAAASSTPPEPAATDETAPTIDVPVVDPPPPVVERPVAEKPRAPREPQTTTKLTPAFGIGVLGAALPGFATSTALSLSFGVSFVRNRGLSPALFLAAGRTLEHAINGLDGAHARWTRARLDACPHVFTPSLTTTLTACATFSAGMLEASARTFEETAPAKLPWLSVGALARLTTWFGPVGQGLEIGAEVPLRRDRLVAERRGRETRVPAIAPFLGLFVAVRIP